MLGLKIFVRVQTFRRAPLARSRNFCHPAWCYNCPSQKWQQRHSQVGACVPLDTVLQMKWLLRVMVSLRASTQFTPATSNAHAPLRDEEPNGRKLAHTIRWQIHMYVCIIAQELFTSSVHQKDRRNNLCTTGAILLVD